jgi:ATP-dependent Clp protease ATP-binding subunit ClpX
MIDSLSIFSSVIPFFLYFPALNICGINTLSISVCNPRFPTTITVEELTKQELIKVLTSVKNNFIDQYTYLFSIDEIDLSFTDDAIEEMVINCINSKTGARGLQTEIERVLMPHMFNAGKYKKKGITELNIDKESIINPKKIA